MADHSDAQPEHDKTSCVGCEHTVQAVNGGSLTRIEVRERRMMLGELCGWAGLCVFVVIAVDVKYGKGGNRSERFERDKTHYVDFRT